MSKFKGLQRKVKIDYSILEELLTPLITYDYLGIRDEYSDDLSIFKIDNRLKLKAKNILKNS